LGDHALSFDSFPRRNVPAFLSEYLRPMPFNLSAVGTLNVTADGGCRDIKKGAFNPFQTFRDLLGRLIVHQVMFDESPQFLVPCDLLPNLPPVPHADVAYVSGIFGVVGFLPPLLPEFVPYRALCPVKYLPDILERVLSFMQNLNLSSVGIGNA